MASDPTKITNPTFAVVVPCFLSEATLAETLCSVSNQTFTDWECVIVIDGSPDRCIDIARDYSRNDHRFRIVKQANGGLSNARNAGIRNSSAPYILFLDSDDLIEIRKLESHFNVGLEANRIDYGGCSFFSQSGAMRQSRDIGGVSWGPKISGNGIAAMEVLAKANPVPVSAPVVSRITAVQVGGFDEALRAMEDWDFWIRCTVFGCEWRFIENAATFIRVSEGSMSSDSARMFYSEFSVRRKHKNLPAMRYEFKRLRKFHLKAAISNCVHGKFRQAIMRFRYLLTFV